MSIPFHLTDPKIPKDEARRRMIEWRNSTRRLTTAAWVVAAVGALALVAIVVLNSMAQ